MQWLCQLGQGVMAGVEDGRLVFRHTGYPYPEMGKPQQELLFEFLQPACAFGDLDIMAEWYPVVVQWLNLLYQRYGKYGCELGDGFYTGYGLADYVGLGYAVFGLSGEDGVYLFLPVGCSLGVFPYLGRVVLGGIPALLFVTGLSWWVGSGKPVFANLSVLSRGRATLFVERVLNAFSPEIRRIVLEDIGIGIVGIDIQDKLKRYYQEKSIWLCGLTGAYFESVLLPQLLGAVSLLALDAELRPACYNIGEENECAVWRYAEESGLVYVESRWVAYCMQYPERVVTLLPNSPFWLMSEWVCYDHVEVKNTGRVYFDPKKLCGSDLVDFWLRNCFFERDRAVYFDNANVVAVYMARMILGDTVAARWALLGKIPKLYGDLSEHRVLVEGMTRVFYLLEQAGIKDVGNNTYMVWLTWGDCFVDFFLELGLDNIMRVFGKDIRARAFFALYSSRSDVIIGKKFVANLEVYNDEDESEIVITVTLVS